MLLFKNIILKLLKKILIKLNSYFLSFKSSIQVIFFCYLFYYEHTEEDKQLNIVDRFLKIISFFKECFDDILETHISIKLFKILSFLVKITKIKFIGIPLKLIFKFWFLYRKFSLNYTWLRFYVSQQILLWLCVIIWFVGYTYDLHNDRFLYEYFLILVVMNYNIYTLGVYMFKITVMKPFDYIRAISTMFILNWFFYWFSLPIWHFIMDHMDKGMTYRSIPILRKYESKLDEIPMFEADLKSRMSIKKKKELAKEKIKIIKLKKKEFKEKRRLQIIAEKKTLLGALKHFFLDMLWNVAGKIAYKKIINDSKFMIRATDVPADMKPIATEHISRLLLNLKRFTYSKKFNNKKNLNSFKNYLSIAFRKLKFFFNVKSLQEKYLSKLFFAENKKQMDQSVLMRDMFNAHRLEMENERLTEKLNEYRSKGLLSKREARDLKEMSKDFFGDNIQTDIDIKSNLIARVERKGKYKNLYKKEIAAQNLDKMINEFDYRKFKDDDYSFIKTTLNKPTVSIKRKNEIKNEIQKETKEIQKKNNKQVEFLTNFIDEQTRETKSKSKKITIEKLDKDELLKNFLNTYSKFNEKENKNKEIVEDLRNSPGGLIFSQSDSKIKNDKPVEKKNLNKKKDIWRYDVNTEDLRKKSNNKKYNNIQFEKNKKKQYVYKNNKKNDTKKEDNLVNDFITKKFI